MEPLGSISTAQSYARTQQAAVTTSAAATGEASAERQGLRLPEDRVNLSGQRPGDRQGGRTATEQDPAAREPKPGEGTTLDGRSLQDPQVRQVVERLKRTEEKVKAHEAAHKAAGGNLASSATYSYTQGPDGRSYITGGEVQIDMSPGRTPQETISKMQQVIRAALAPADPSGQDRSVAAQAASQMAQAQQQKLQESAPLTAADPAAATQPQSRAQQAYGDPTVQRDRANAPASSMAPPMPSSNPGRRPQTGLSAYA